MPRRNSKGQFCSADGTVTQRPKKWPPHSPVGQFVAAPRTLHVALVVDASSSMASIMGATESCYRSLMRTFAEEAVRNNITTRLTVVQFSDKVRVDVSNVLAMEQPQFLYWPAGMTALFDGVGKAVAELRAHPADQYLVMTLTDGEENQSRSYTAERITGIMDELQKQGNWTFTYQLPYGQKHVFSRKFGIPLENIVEWEATQEGIQHTTKMSQVATRTYMGNAAMGQTMSSNFFVPVTTNLASLQAADLGKLSDLSARFKSITVEKECPIRSLVEAKTGKAYVMGCAYYQLMKKEEVQPQKEVLLMQKGNKAVYGGQEARNLIGLPQGQNARVTPGNHANFDIFLQSASTNRILPRGTKVLVDTTKVTPSQATWEKT